MNDRFRISRLMAERLAEHKLSLPALARLAGLPAGFFQADKVYATTAEFFALWKAIGELSPDPALGLKLGSEPRFERYQPSMLAAVCSRSFRDALQRIARYKQLTCPEEIRLHSTRDEAAVEFCYLQTDAEHPEVLVDLCLSWILSVGQRGTDGYIKPRRVELTRPPRHRELLEKHFGCPVRFKAERNALVFHPTDLDRPFVTHNEELLKAIGAQLESELEERQAGTPIGEQVKRALKRSLAGKRPTLPQVAQEMGMSARTLQRRLTEAQLTFQQLVEETRRELARHYLKHSAVELNEAAFLLGYEDANSFFRAFHLWEGTTPGEWRMRHSALKPALASN